MSTRKFEAGFVLTLNSIVSPGRTLVFETYPSISDERRLRIKGYEAIVIGISNPVYCSCHSTVPGLLFSSSIAPPFLVPAVASVFIGDTDAESPRSDAFLIISRRDKPRLDFLITKFRQGDRQ